MLANQDIQVTSDAVVVHANELSAAPDLNDLIENADDSDTVY